VGDAGDVQPTGGDIGGDEQSLATALEGEHDAVARALGHVAVQGLDPHPAVTEAAGEAVDADLRPDEDDRLLRPLGLDHPGEGLGLLPVDGHLDVELLDGVDGEGRGRTRMISGSYMNRSASPWIGGGMVAEKSAVWRRRGAREDRLDVLEEAEVEHLVRLVEDHEAARVEHELVPAHEVLDPADGADHHLPPWRSWATWLRIGAPPNTATTWIPRFAP
jgi:hypothetical protein